MAKLRERKMRYFNQVKCIKDDTNRLLVKDNEIKDMWRDHFDELFNYDNDDSMIELDDAFDDTDRRFVRRIQESEVRGLKKDESG